MPAPNLPTLYDFETNFEAAVSNYFTNANSTWQVLNPRTLANVTLGTDFLQTPRITSVFELGATGDQKAFAGNSPTEYYCERTGTMTIDAVVSRQNTAQDYRLMRGTGRVAMLERTQAFNANSLPYYQVVDIVETGATQSVNPENDELLTKLSFMVKFAILPASFP